MNQEGGHQPLPEAGHPRTPDKNMEDILSGTRTRVAGGRRGQAPAGQSATDRQDIMDELECDVGGLWNRVE